MRQAYSNEAWCRAHNHPCDPELFDNFLVGDVVVNDATAGLAFRVAFDNTVYWSDVERWRLSSFRYVRAYLLENAPVRTLPDELFMHLYDDLRRAEQFPGGPRMLQTLQADPELRDLVAVAAAAERRPDQNWRAFFDALDARWERPEVWGRLARAIVVPAEFTEVVYIYRNAANGLPIEYREILLSDLYARFGRAHLQRYLERDVLARIFGP